MIMQDESACLDKYSRYCFGYANLNTFKLLKEYIPQCRVILSKELE